MNLETFFKNFEFLVDAPNGVQKLRELILQLAVMGKLVPQDENDEPASVLLEKIRVERNRLISDKKIKNPKQLPLISVDELPYKKPGNWVWCRLGEIIQISSGDALTSSKMSKSGNIPVYGGNGITGYHDESNVNKQILVIGRVGYYCGSIHITPEQAWITDNAFVTYFSESNIDIRFLYWLLKATNLQKNSNATAQPVISGAKVYPIVVGLPPLNEQKRIVAKVDELMTQCDRLSERQQKRRETRIIINNAAIGQLLTAREPEVFNKSWQNICNNFDLLYSTPDNIGKLRQAILQLAVQGKLVPQDENDEPASVLLEKIKFEKERLVEEGKIRKLEYLTSVKASEILFEVPEEWKWVRLGEIGYFLGGGTPSKSNHSFWEGKIPWVSPKDMKKPYIFDVTDHISVEALKQSSVQLIPQNSLLMVVRGMILSHSFPVAISMTELTINQDMKALHFLISEISEYVLLACRALQWVMLKNVARSSHGTCRISSKDLSEFMIPLPPLAEQKRIVAKVDELMALCNTLETKLTQSVTNSEQLMEAAVRQILAANSNKADKHESNVLENIPAENTKLETKTGGRPNKKTQQDCVEGLQLKLPGFQ